MTGLTDTYSQYVTKFDSPMACYVYDAWLMNGDYGDDEAADDCGNWANRYGRRILSGDDIGFVYLTKFDTEDEARVAFNRIAEYLHRYPECEHSEDNATDPNFDPELPCGKCEEDS